MGVALAVRNQPGSALSNALSIASLINGPILGVFLVGTFLRRVSQPPALIGMLVSIGSMLYVFLATKIAWPWYVLLGSLIAVSWAASFAFAPSAKEIGPIGPIGPITEEGLTINAQAQSLFLGNPDRGSACLCALPVTPQDALKVRPFKREPSSKALKWANDVLRKMSLEEKVGQLISIGVNATFSTRIPTLFACSSARSKPTKSAASSSFRGLGL